MKILTMRKGNEYRIGVLTDRGVLDVQAAATRFEESVPLTMEELVASGSECLQSLARLVLRTNSSDDTGNLYLAEDSVEFGPCLTNPEKIICVGTNYRQHAIESNMPIPTSPVLFSKFNNALSAHQAKVKIPELAEKVDYEVELVIVMGRKADHVNEADALSYVFGYCVGNDLSDRGLQFKTGQWLLGKTCDGFAPVGPYITTADEIGNPQNLKLECRVNGELRQSSSTQDMIFDCASIISYVSHHMTLKPGDLIFTGTPQGVILGYPENEQMWLQSGDEIEVSIQNLGVLRTVLE